MKYSDYGDSAGIKVSESKILLNNENGTEFFKDTDVFSARTLNRPIKNIYENQVENYKLIQSLLKSVYGNFNGIVPNVFESFNKERFIYGSIKNNAFIRIPTGLLFARKSFKTDHSYYIPGEENYQDDISSDLLNDDYSFSIINQPNINLFERQLAFLINFDLNDQQNDIKVNCEFVDDIPHYSITVTDNSNEVIELPKNYWVYEDGAKVKSERDITYRDNAIDLFNDFLDYFEDEIILSDNELYKLNCLETVIPIDSGFTSHAKYYLYYKIKGQETSSDNGKDLNGKFYISLGSGDSDSIKLFTLQYTTEEVDTYTKVTSEELAELEADSEESEGEVESGEESGEENESEDREEFEGESEVIKTVKTPSSNEWYELVNYEYVRTSDSVVDPNKEYYKKSLKLKEGVIATPSVDTLDQRLIATKRAELDTLLVRRRSNISGDVFIQNGKSGLTLTSEKFELFNNNTNIDISKDKVSTTSDSIENTAETIKNTADNFEIKNAEISLKDTNGLKVSKGEEEVLSASFNENNELQISYKEKNLLDIKDNEITTYKSIIPNKDRTLTLGTTARRFLKVYGDIYGNTTSASILHETDNLIISNLTLEETRDLKHDIGKKVLSDKTVVYHFDTNYKDNFGNDDLTLGGDYELSVEYDEETGEPDNPVFPYEPFQEEGRYIAGGFTLKRSDTTSDKFSVDFWYKYTHNSDLKEITGEEKAHELFRIGSDNEFIALQNHASEIDFWTDVEEVDGELVETIPFYNPIEYLQGYIEDGYVDGSKYVASDFGKIVTTEETVDGVVVEYENLEPIYFIELDDEDNEIIVLHDSAETILTKTDSNEPIGFTKDEWLHICVTFDTNEINLFINDYKYTFVKNNYVSAFQIMLYATAVDELMVDNSYVESFEEFSTFNESGNRLNYGMLDYSEQNFIIDVKDLTNLHTNLFETDAFVEAVKKVVNNM